MAVLAVRVREEVLFREEVLQRVVAEVAGDLSESEQMPEESNV